MILIAYLRKYAAYLGCCALDDCSCPLLAYHAELVKKILYLISLTLRSFACYKRNAYENVVCCMQMLRSSADTVFLGPHCLLTIE